jgi:flagella basal body P-ring formation protein FlgA
MASRILVSFILFFVFGINLFANEPLIIRDVTLKSNVEVWTNEVCLHDILEEAWVKQRCAYEKEKCCHWKIESGSKMNLSVDEVESIIKKINFSGIGLNIKNNNFKLIQVTQTKRLLSAEEIKSALESVLVSYLPQFTELKNDELNIGVNVNDIKMQTNVYVNVDGEKDWDIELPAQVNDNFMFKIVSKVDGQLLGYAYARVYLQVPAYVANRTIRPMESVESKDFEIRLTKISLSDLKNSSKIILKGNFPELSMARITIEKGQPLKLSMLERKPTVKLGDMVTVILKSDNIQITTKGTAQGVGGSGDLIRVSLPRFNKSFRGKVVQGNVVEVWL